MVAVEAGPAVGTDLETHPGPPAGCPAGADGLGRAGPGEPAEALQLIGHHLALDGAQRGGVGERHVAAARSVDAGDRAQRLDPLGCGLQDLHRYGVPIGSAFPGDADPDRLTGQRVADEDDAAVVASLAFNGYSAAARVTLAA